MEIKIYGYGWVGKAMHKLFPNAHIYDPELKLLCDKKCDIAIVCVPTNLKNGKLDTSIVEKVVLNSKEDLIIIRSTVMPGTCDKLTMKKKKVVFIPEYLGETVNHPMTEQLTRPFMIVGGRHEDRRKAIELFQTVYNANIKIRQVRNYEAEIIKLSENRAIAYKIAQCQELYDACENARVDYYSIRDAVYGDDPRFNLWFSFVYPKKRGFQSKCLPKDVYGWCAWAESVGIKPELTLKMLSINEKYIR